MGNKKLTIEVLAYTLILIISIGFRFVNLGQAPLDDQEAANALGALNLVQGKENLLPGQPGYISLTAATFFIFDSSEFFARFWPALIGSCIVIIPRLFRKILGTFPAVLLAVFLAVDPLLISASRNASGGMIALSGLLAAIGFWYNRKTILSGIALGLALVGGVDLWPGVIATLVAIAIFISSMRKMETQPSFPTEQKLNMRGTGIATAVTIVFLSTLFLLKPQVISTLGSSLVEYVSSWSVQSPLKFYTAGIAWLITLLPGVILAAWGFFSGEKAKIPLIRFLGIWSLCALILALANPSRQALELFWASIPLWTLAALKVAELLTESKIESRLILVVESAAVIALFIFSFLYFADLINSSIVDPIELRNRVIGVLLPLVLIVVLTILLAKGWSADSARKGCMIGIGILLFTGLIGSSWKAANFGIRSENEIWSGSATPVGRSLLITSVEDLSRWSTGQSTGIDILLKNNDLPSLNWALRKFTSVDHDTVHNPHISPSIIITRVDTEISAQSTYRGQKIVWLAEPDYRNMSINDWLKWVVFRETPQKSYELLLWARNDLFNGIET